MILLNLGQLAFVVNKLQNKVKKNCKIIKIVKIVNKE
jgi:hypothetical protein